MPSPDKIYSVEPAAGLEIVDSLVLAHRQPAMFLGNDVESRRLGYYFGLLAVNSLIIAKAAGCGDHIEPVGPGNPQPLAPTLPEHRVCNYEQIGAPDQVFSYEPGGQEPCEGADPGWRYVGESKSYH